MFSKNLSAALLKIIDEKNITQEDLAEICDLSPRFIGNIIRGHSSMRLDTFEKICSGLEVTPDEILIPKNSPPVSAINTKQVTQVFYLNDSVGGFPICPNCKRTIEHEFQSFCDRCGQRLGWKEFKSAEVVDDISLIK